MATSLTGPPLVFIAWFAASLPRPPQPIIPILISSLPNEWAARAILSDVAAMAPPATSREDLRMKSRREVPLGEDGMDMVCSEVSYASRRGIWGRARTGFAAG